MANKFTDFLKDFLGDTSSFTGKKSGADKIDTEILKELFEEYQQLTDAMDDNAHSISAYKKELNDAKIAMDKATPNSQEYHKAADEIKRLVNTIEFLKLELKKLEGTAHDFIDSNAKKHKLDPKSLNNNLKAFDKFNDSFDTGGLSKSGKVTKGIFDGISKGVGKLGFDMSGTLGNAMKFLESPITALAVAAEMAGEQIIDLNDKLIKFQREMNGSLNARLLGMDIYGNNRTIGNTDSLTAMAKTNGLEEKDILDVFKQGFKNAGQLGGPNVKGKERELQAYGLQVAKLNKLYGISGEVSGKVANVLMNQYGKGIQETSEILQKGAVAAKQAGVNVGIFFDNMAKIADLQGSLFVKGGAEGIEKAAFALTKLGLSAEKLSKLNDAYQGFGDLVDKQQKQLALGLQNLSSAQSRIFAKVQTGDSAGALRTQQFAAAADVKRLGYTDKGGMITNQGIQSLKAAGMDADEIKSTQRIINMANKLGVSFEALEDETKLTKDQLQKKRDLEQEELTTKEKLNGMWANIKAVLIDPIAQVLAPVFDLVIEGLSKTFSVLKMVMAPVLMVFQILGKVLGGVAAAFRKIWDAVERAVQNFMKLFGFNSNNGEGMSKVMEGISKGIDILIDVISFPLNIIATVIGWIADGIGWLVDNLSDIFGGIWDFFSGSDEKDSNNSVVNNSQNIVNGGDAGSSTSTTTTLMNAMMPQMFIWNEIYGLLDDWFGFDKKKDERDQPLVKIASAAVGPTNADVARIMEARKLDNNYAQQSATENMVNSNALKGQGNPQIIINNKFSTEYGGMKTKIQGK
jgi:hypothetical protein